MHEHLGKLKKQRPAELELTSQDIPFPATRLPQTGEA